MAPIRLRLDLPVAVGPADTVSEPLLDAVTRALRRARRQLADDQATGQAIMTEPDFTWTGPACDRVSSAQRSALEQLVSSPLRETHPIVAPKPRITVIRIRSQPWLAPGGSVAQPARPPR